MSTSTLVLILKSLYPFLREILLKDKGLQDLLLGNKLATILSACLLFVFIVCLYMNEVANNAFAQVKSLTQANASLIETNAEKSTRITDLEDKNWQLQWGKGSKPPAAAPPADGTVVATPQDAVLTTPPPAASGAKDRRPAKRPQRSLKSFASDQMKQLENGGN